MSAKKAVTVRLDAAQHAALAKAAARESMPVAILARALLAFGVEQLAAGNAAVERPVRISRDGLRGLQRQGAEINPRPREAFGDRPSLAGARLLRVPNDPDHRTLQVLLLRE